jgi:hypothetical protein
MRYLTVLLLLASPVAAQQASTFYGAIDATTLVPFTAPPEYATWWGEVVTLSHRQPAADFAKLEWWTTTVQLRCPVQTFGCEVYGVFLAPKDIVLRPSDQSDKCWVMHEMAHAILGKGDEAHGDPLFSRVKRSCR